MFKKTTSQKRVKYKSTPRKDEFFKILKGRVDQYFIDNDISKHANGMMYFKTVLAFVAWAIAFSLIITNTFSYSYGATILAFCVASFSENGK